MRCGRCQHKIDEKEDVYFFDEDLNVFCSPVCRVRGLNYKLMFEDVQKDLRGWNHRKTFYETYEVLRQSTEQEIWDKCIEAFQLFDIDKIENGVNVELVKDIMRHIKVNKKITQRQRKVLEFFVASVTEQKHRLSKEVVRYARVQFA